GHVHLDRGRGHDGDVDHFAAGGEQAAGYGVLQHGSARAAVASHHDAAWSDISGEGLGKGAGERGSEKFADHAANSGDTHFEQMLSHAELRTCSSRDSKRRRGASPRCSQITRTMGSVWLTRTWNQWSGQSMRRPSTAVARPSGNFSRRLISSAGM